jgi:hypothetical protein
MAIDIEPKICPFCNGAGIVQVVWDKPISKMAKIKGYYVECGKCFATRGGRAHETKQEAIADWNERGGHHEQKRRTRVHLSL